MKKPQEIKNSGKRQVSLTMNIFINFEPSILILSLIIGYPSI